LCAGLEVAGFKVVKVGLITWPMLAFLVRHFKAQGGVVVTASHNPKIFNGLKFIGQSGINYGGAEILKKINKSKTEFGSSRAKKLITSAKSYKPEEIYSIYARYLEGFIRSKSKIKIVIDCSNGAVGPIIRWIKFPGNITPIFINTKPDGNFPAHGPDPTAKGAINQASKEIIKEGADCGVVFDGDGDRVVFLDNKGKVIRPEYVWWLAYLTGEIKNTIANVTDEYLMSRLSEQISPSPKIKYVRVGHTFVRLASRESRSDMTVESSAHYYFKEDNYSGCGILAMIKVINSLAGLPYAFSRFLYLLPKSFWLPEINKTFDVKKIKELFKDLKKHFEREAVSFEFIDGLSAFGKNWWFNVRPSNTEDLVRINIEAKDKNKLGGIKKQLLKFF
jgi:phosphomannomutase